MAKLAVAFFYTLYIVAVKCTYSSNEDEAIVKANITNQESSCYKSEDDSHNGRNGKGETGDDEPVIALDDVDICHIHDFMVPMRLMVWLVKNK